MKDQRFSWLLLLIACVSIGVAVGTDGVGSIVFFAVFIAFAFAYAIDGIIWSVRMQREAKAQSQYLDRLMKETFDPDWHSRDKP